MMWDAVIQAADAALIADNDLMTAIGGSANLRPEEDAQEQGVNSVRYQLIADQEEEVMNVVLVTYTYRAQSRATAVIIEKRLRKVLDYPTRRMFGGIEMLTKFDDARDMEDAMPGVVKRQLDFRFEPVKTRIT